MNAPWKMAAIMAADQYTYLVRGQTSHGLHLITRRTVENLTRQETMIKKQCHWTGPHTVKGEENTDNNKGTKPEQTLFTQLGVNVFAAIPTLVYISVFSFAVAIQTSYNKK